MWKWKDSDFKRCSLSKYSGNKETCRWCGTRLSGRQKRWCSVRCSQDATRNHSWSWARKARLAMDLGCCVSCGRTRKQAKLEINHKIPILGRHGEPGCHHHLDGLETLCHNCHLAETNRQRKAGLLIAK